MQQHLHSAYMYVVHSLCRVDIKMPFHLSVHIASIWFVWWPNAIFDSFSFDLCWNLYYVCTRRTHTVGDWCTLHGKPTAEKKCAKYLVRQWLSFICKWRSRWWKCRKRISFHFISSHSSFFVLGLPHHA